MNNVWYVRRGSDVFGPAETERVLEMIKSGQLSATDEAAATWEGPFAPISNIAALRPVRPISEIGSAADRRPPSFSAMPEPNEASPQPNALPADVRIKYLTALSEKGQEWVIVPTLAIAYIVVLGLLDRLGFKSGWVWAVSFIVALMLAGLLANRYTSKRARSLGQKSDKMLEVLYREHERAKLVSGMFKGVGTLVIVAATVWWAYGTTGGERFRLGFTSDASCGLGDVFHRKEVFNVNGQPDDGYVVSTTIENKGKRGRIFVEARLTTSEGTITRHLREEFAAGERRKVEVNFPEPSVSATNASSSVSCSPAR